MTSTASTQAVWTQDEAVALCVQIEAICPSFGCHVALTGGLLYKPGLRKDADILFYRIRQVDEIDVEGLLLALAGIGIDNGDDYGWCVKATYRDKPIDFFFPEREGEEYPPTLDAQPILEPAEAS
jgi:hypothetical protein